MPANFPILGVSSPYFLAKKHKKQTQPTQNARTISQISRKPTKMSHKQKSLQYHVNHQTSPNQPIFPPTPVARLLPRDRTGSEVPFYTGNFTVDQFHTAHVHVGTRYLDSPPRGDPG